MNVKQREGESIRSYLDHFNMGARSPQPRSINCDGCPEGRIAEEWSSLFSREDLSPRLHRHAGRAKKYARVDEVFEDEPLMIPIEDKREERLESPPRSRQPPRSPSKHRRSRTLR